MNDIQHNDTQYTSIECHYAECQGASKVASKSSHQMATLAEACIFKLLFRKIIKMVRMKKNINPKLKKVVSWDFENSMFL